MKLKNRNRLLTKFGVAFLILAGVSALVLRNQNGTFHLAESEWRAQPSPRLVSVEPLPSVEGLECPWISASSNQGISLVSLQQAGEGPSGASDAAGRAPASRELDLAPVRTLEDEYATYSAVAVDPINSVIVADMP